jgi:hypothetical protein
MLPIDKLSYRSIIDVPAGHLIYLLRPAGPVLALRLEHPGGSTGAPSYPAALVLRGIGNKRYMPLVDAGVSKQQHCLDWGMRALTLWKHPLELLAQHTKTELAPGYLIVVGDQTALCSYYAGGAGERMYWNVRTGTKVEPGKEPFAFIAGWRLGVSAADGSFLKLAAYPTDYGDVP